MHLWDYKTMAIICRMVVHESERVLIFIELDARFSRVIILQNVHLGLHVIARLQTLGDGEVPTS